MNNSLETAVIFIIFNRPEKTRLVFRAIAEARPKRLLVIADGPRDSHLGEARLCNEARSIVAGVDWPCEILTNFSATNLGCQERVISGLTWAFDQVEEAIILEDDCLPNQTFFPFCQELLERFRGDSRIGIISGNNFVEPQLCASYSYYFSRNVHIWGWATWRSAWRKYDRHLGEWQVIKRSGVMSDIFSSPPQAAYWTRMFDSMHNGSGPNTWDIQWMYTLLINNMLAVVPKINLVKNIGYGGDGTHTPSEDSDSKCARLVANSIPFPLAHPPYIIPPKVFDDLDYKITCVPKLSKRVRGKISRIFERLGFHRRHQSKVKTLELSSPPFQTGP